MTSADRLNRMSPVVTCEPVSRYFLLNPENVMLKPARFCIKSHFSQVPYLQKLLELSKPLVLSLPRKENQAF